MNKLVGKVRGRPFKPGNAGRPPGSKNKITQMVEQLVEGQAEQLVRKVLELAQAGDVSCLRMILDRLYPLRKGQPVNVVMPPSIARRTCYLPSPRSGPRSATAA